MVHSLDPDNDDIRAECMLCLISNNNVLMKYNMVQNHSKSLSDLYA